MSLAFLSQRSSELPGRGPAMPGLEHRRALSQTFAEAPHAGCRPGDQAGALSIPGGMLSGTRGPGSLPPPTDSALMAPSSRHRSGPQPAGAPYPGIFARSSVVLQNMLPRFPKGLAVLAKGGPRPQGLGSDWLVGPGGDGAREGPDGDGCEDAESVVMCGGKQHSLYKTELCRSWEETGTCRYGSKCQFAHGAAELRDVPRHPKYKTQICCTFATTGTCPYGRRCRFIHQNGPFTAVGAKTSEQPQPKTTLPSSLGPRWPVRQQVTQEPTASASRRLPVFVKLSTANPTSLVMT